jgi:hypothetical protein
LAGEPKAEIFSRAILFLGQPIEAVIEVVRHFDLGYAESLIAS